MTEMGYAGRFVVRILWCVVLQVPWCLFGLAIPRADNARATSFGLLSLLTLGLVTAIGVPVSFLAVFMEQQTALAREAWAQGQVREAHRSVYRLCDIGSTLSLGERPVAGAAQRAVSIGPRQARQDLAQAVEFVEQRIRKLESEPLTDSRRMQLVDDYRSLDEYGQAIEAIRPLATRLPTAALRMAELQLTLKRSEESQQWAEKAIQLAQESSPQDPESQRLLEIIQLRAYEMLAVFAGERADFGQAEQILQEALEQLPVHAAYLHDRLGTHYEFIGELATAREHQLRAAELDPDRYVPPEDLLRKMLSTGAPVGLARPKSSRYQ